MLEATDPNEEEFKQFCTNIQFLSINYDLNFGNLVLQTSNRGISNEHIRRVIPE